MNVYQWPWQPIETAPRDGSRVILFRPGLGLVDFGSWNDCRHAGNPRPYWAHDPTKLASEESARNHPPSHWMPEPPNPAALEYLNRTRKSVRIAK